MSPALNRLFCFAVALAASLQVRGQTTVQPDQTQPARVDQVPRVPGIGTLLKGVNAGVTSAAVHDSYLGWYAVATPAFSYTF